MPIYLRGCGHDCISLEPFSFTLAVKETLRVFSPSTGSALGRFFHSWVSRFGFASVLRVTRWNWLRFLVVAFD